MASVEIPQMPANLFAGAVTKLTFFPFLKTC